MINLVSLVIVAVVLPISCSYCEIKENFNTLICLSFQKKPLNFIKVKFTGPAQEKAQSIIIRLFKLLSGEEENLPESIKCKAR